MKDGGLVNRNEDERVLIISVNRGGVAIEKKSILKFGRLDQGHRLLQFQRPRVDQRLKVGEVGLLFPRQTPFFRQRDGELENFSAIERLLKEKQLVFAAAVCSRCPVRNNRKTPCK